jgi:hypothetical protein
MRNFWFTMVSILFVLAATGSANAGFIDNYRAWQQIGPEGQAAYAMGIFDVMIVFVAGDQYSTARALGLRQCGGALQLKAAMMAQAITKYYEDHPESQKASPFVAFNAYLERGACSPFINAARAQMGLQPMKKP